MKKLRGLVQGKLKYDENVAAYWLSHQGCWTEIPYWVGITLVKSLRLSKPLFIDGETEKLSNLIKATQP